MKLFAKKTSKRSASARRKLEAAVARRASRSPMIEEDEEPTTSFKTALVVVLLLHVVAGIGIFMFDRIKTRHLGAAEGIASAKKTSLIATAPAAARPKPSAIPAAPVETAKKSVPAATAAPVAAASPASRATPTPHTAPASELKDSGKTYTVLKGDKLASIAKKLHVSYDDLMKLNKIADPKKLRIGQKLHIPAKPKSSN